ncbi:hypothetical protein D3C79_1079580 [compost metagenome]
MISNPFQSQDIVWNFTRGINFRLPIKYGVNHANICSWICFPDLTNHALHSVWESIINSKLNKYQIRFILYNLLLYSTGT